MNIYPLLALALRTFQVGWEAGMVVVSVGVGSSADDMQLSPA